MFKYWIECESHGQKFYYSIAEETIGIWTDDETKRMIWNERKKAAGYFLDMVEIISCDEIRLICREA